MNNQGPTFIIIGPGRTGSTSLYEYFRGLDEIQLAKNIKETNFFNFNYDKGIDWYLNFFTFDNPKTIRGEISNMYIYNTKVAKRIYNHFPDVQIISILRNPYDRLISMYNHKIQKGELDQKINIENAIKYDRSIIERNYYGSLLEPFYNIFESSNIFVSTYDLLEEDAPLFLKNILSFIGISIIDNRNLDLTNHNPSRILRNTFFSGVIRSSADTLRKLKFFYILDRLKRSKMVNSILFKESGVETRLSHEIVEELKISFNPEIIKTEKLTGLDLSAWYNGPTNQ